ncbi:unnamed protein product [Haemonchus placei]|uniref:Uncharacterized protein n=1 Tax=Haemonchus placei TaxID=6290 RepID=A0A0N4W8B6_HAEPC|nr:unnamed protein product [Haemonchus placei]
MMEKNCGGAVLVFFLSSPLGEHPWSSDLKRAVTPADSSERKNFDARTRPFCDVYRINVFTVRLLNPHYVNFWRIALAQLIDENGNFYTLSQENTFETRLEFKNKGILERTGFDSPAL